ncbi:chromosome partition protein Smc-like isoform X1 [Ruditapes philippinarum]|uniref:chromosome partition protein Smc-like isoform X1 n=2 Tax=Ruditapes philippinarum TaxID=129788 RepID=UPI00295AF7FC|nr:chromosome partition protein Smc-like isoform X1 [Ruditapes philippinarum]
MTRRAAQFIPKKPVPLIKIGSAMATGGTVMAPGDRTDSSRDKLGIQGHGLMTTRSQDGSLGLPSNEPSPSVSRPSTATSGESPADGISSISMPPEAVGVLETVINMNKALEQQIDTLRMRLTVESKNHDTEKYKIIKEKEKEIDKKESEIDDLKDSLVHRDERVTCLVKEAQVKDFQIQQKEKEINDLKELVKQTEGYAEQLQKRVGRLKDDKHKLETETGYKEQSEEIRKLKHEIVSMKEKVTIMEKELGKARNIIDQQNTKISGMEAEKGAMSEKFKEELERASKAMRSEVERMREVMKQQYMEMRNLREQNIEISSDVRDIKDILLNGTLKKEPEIKTKTTEKIDVNNFKSPRPMHKSPNFGMRMPLTSRQAPAPKLNSTVRTSMPSMSTTRGQTQGKAQSLPPISKANETTTGKWIPAGGTHRQATLNVRSAKGGRR